MRVRKAVLTDAKGMAKVNVDSWRTTYQGIVSFSFLEDMSYEVREEAFKRTLENSQNIVFVAENENDSIIGYIVGGENRYQERFSNYQGELFAIYLLEDYHKKGIGKLLVREFRRDLRKNGIENMMVQVLKDNPSRSFYEKLGATYIGEAIIEIDNQELIEVVLAWSNLSFVM